MKTKSQNQIRKRRAQRARARIVGTSIRPRLSVFRSNRHIVAQLIDDTEGKTIVSASSYNDKKNTKQKKSDVASSVGEAIAKRAVEKGITKAIFDRGSYKFHGRIQAVCEGARSAGLKI